MIHKHQFRSRERFHSYSALSGFALFQTIYQQPAHDLVSFVVLSNSSGASDLRNCLHVSGLATQLPNFLRSTIPLGLPVNAREPSQIVELTASSGMEANPKVV